MSSVHPQNGHYYYFNRINGQQIKKKLDVRTKSQANKLKDELDMMYARMKLGLRHIKTISLQELLKEYKDYLYEHKKPERYNRLHSMWKNFRDFFNMNDTITLEDIKPITFENFKKWRKSTIGYREEPISDKTVNEEMTELKNMMDFAVENNYLYEFNIDMRKVRIKKPKKRVRDYFKDYQVHEIFNAGLPHTTYYKILYYTGLRPADIGRLKPEHIKTEVIQKNGKKIRFKYIELLTGKQDVWIALPIHDEILPYFDLKQKEGLLFPQYRTGGRRNSPYRQLKKFLDTKDWEGNFSPYSFRHSYNQKLTGMNIEQSTRAQLMGQDSAESNKPYTHMDIVRFYEIMTNYNLEEKNS